MTILDEIRVDLEYWARKPLWMLFEAVAIVVHNIDPRVFSEPRYRDDGWSGPRLAMNFIAGFQDDLNRACVLAKLGWMDARPDGTNDQEIVMFWVVRPEEFRRAWGKSEDDKRPAPRYETPLLRITHAAIATFFEPRRSVDPKREDVVDWIKRQMAQAGLPESDNIAQAIFTVIKPPDHDPRKRRV